MKKTKSTTINIRIDREVHKEFLKFEKKTKTTHSAALWMLLDKYEQSVL